MSDFTPEKLRARFHELTAKAEAIRKKAGPLREKRDELLRHHAAELALHNDAIRKAERGLYEIEQERAMISRAVSGRNVGDPEDR